MARSVDEEGKTMKSTTSATARNHPKASETCYFCMRGVVEEKHVTVDFRWGDKLVIIENVPAKVCNECGERYYAATVVRQMEQLAQQERAEREMRVPVMTLA
jgi:YgiT-type zinc finger domain-containing protein